MQYSISLFFLLLSTSVAAQTGDTAVLKVQYTEDHSLRADTSAAFWKEAVWIDMPRREGSALYQTKFKLLYSAKGVYCLFFSEDKRITSTIKENFADLYNEDVVEAFFWPEPSSTVYFEYELSPRNYELPILVPNYNGKFLGWLPWHYDGERKTKHETTIYSNRSWTAAFFIPYALLKPLPNVPPQKGTTWRANFYRIDYDENSTSWSWQLTGPSFHDLAAFGTLLFD